MRQVLLAAMVLGTVLGFSSPASAQMLGFRYGGYGGAWPYPPVVAYAPGYYGAVPVAPYGGYPYYPYPYASSYFRPDGPYGRNIYRNWRDTWQDDGVKVHSYTLH